MDYIVNAVVSIGITYTTKVVELRRHDSHEMGKTTIKQL